MNHSLTKTVLLSVLLATSGCAHSLYFYETQKIALALEGKPDPNQPVSGSFGGKARTAVVVPSKDPANETSANEAGSMISMFHVNKTAAGVFGTVTLTSMLVTGDAAVAANREGTTTGLAAIAVDAPPIPSATQNARTAISNVAADEKARFDALIEKCDWAVLTTTERGELGTITGLDLNFAESNYTEIKRVQGKCKKGTE